MRKMVIGGALAATLAAAWFAPDDSADMISAASARTPEVQAAQAGPAPSPVFPAIRPRLPDDDMGDAFARQSWQPAPPKKAMMEQAAAAAPAPASAAKGTPGAPPMPIRFLGHFVEDGAAAYFLQIDERNIVAHVGDTIDDTYRLDSAAGGTLTFTYLPLNQKQELAAGELD